jgi:CheY-like chemotaxis protein
MGAPLRVLVVDDRPEDWELTVQQLRRHLVSNPLETAETGEECMKRLLDASLPRIDLVLLDAKLPRMSGQQVIDAIKGDPALAHVRVVLLTNLAPARHTAAAAPDAVLEKPLQVAALFRALRRLGGCEVQIVACDAPAG